MKIVKRVDSMMHKILAVAALVATVVFAGGCAYQYRTSTPQISSSSLASLYDCILAQSCSTSNTGTNSSTGSSSTTVTPTGATSSTQGLLNQDQTALAFYAESDSSRPVWSVLAFNEMGLLSSQWSSSSGMPQPVFAESSGLQHVDVIFVDGYNIDSSGNPVRSFELLMKFIDSQGNITYSVWDSIPGTTSFSNGLFDVEMNPVQGTGQQLWLQSSDINSSQEFNASIQLQVFDANGNPAGQISTMTGFE